MLFLYLISGCVFYASVFYLFRCYFRTKFSSKYESTEAVATAVSMRCISALQAISACMVGFITVYITYQDVIYDKSPVLTPYCNFCFPYMIYDIYAMFITYQAERSHQQQVAFLQEIKSFLKKRWLITFHHLAIAVFLYPVFLFYTNDKGHFFIGCLMLTELSTPFINIREIMRKLQWNQPTLSLVNDFIFMSMFFICRILLFPFMYAAYARYKHLHFYQVPASIPMKCNLGCLIILVVQCVWFRLIVKAAVRRVKSSRAIMVQERKIDQAVEVNCNHVGKEK